jgi:LacI family transcriptional regulator
MRRPGLGFPHVLLDNAAAARLAADEFLARGFTCFLFYSERENWTFDERGTAFVQAVGEGGHPCRWACWGRSPSYRKGKEEWVLRRKWLARELKGSPKPLAVLAANDDQAVEVLETCENMGLSVPAEVAIIGIDNALHAVEAMATPLSSVDMNHEGLGYRGAALLADLMHGARSPAEPVRVPIAGLITRKSSDAFAVRHPGMARSLRYMLDHYDESLSVNDLAQIAGMSLRAYHTAFQQTVGRTPGRELRQTRIQAAKRLLVESDEKIATIAGMCGFQSANGFWWTFRKITGLSPKQYREQKGPHPRIG